MSYKALAIAWEADGLSSGEKLVFISLADQANHDGLCWPSQKKTAARTGLSRQTVNQHIRSLEDRGLLSKVERSRYRMVYQVQMSGNPTPEMSDIPTPDVGKSDSRCRESRQPSEPSINHQRTNGHSQEIEELFSYWKTTLNHPRAKLDQAREGRILKALKIGYTVDELKQAIDGCAVTPYNRGQNDSGTVYDDIELICRNAPNIDRFIANASKSRGGRPIA